METVKYHHNHWRWGESWKIVINEGDCIGEASIQTDRPEECFFSGLSTVPEARRKGLGSFCLQIAEGIGIDHNCAYVALYVEKEQQDNVAFYQKRGYILHHEDGIYWEMRKDLN